MDYMNIIPTHNFLRNLDSFKALVADPSLILKAERPPLILNVEGQTYLNDGHHRLTAAIYVGIPLSDIKLQFATYSYAQMMAPNFKIGWLTPYDPRTHVRLNDCLTFKQYMSQAYIDLINEHGEAKAQELTTLLIEMCTIESYCETRKVFNMYDLAKTLNKQIPNKV